jgi:hypothetical protein
VFSIGDSNIKCYGFDEDSKLLCNNEKDLLEFNIPKLYSLYTKLENTDSKIYELLSNIFDTL